MGIANWAGNSQVEFDRLLQESAEFFFDIFPREFEVGLEESCERLEILQSLLNLYKILSDLILELEKLSLGTTRDLQKGTSLSDSRVREVVILLLKEIICWDQRVQDFAIAEKLFSESFAKIETMKEEENHFIKWI